MNIRSQIIWGTILVFGFYLPAFGLDASDTGLVGWWKFDDESGLVAEDSSGYGNHGMADSANWCEGIIDGALGFDGKSSVLISPWVFSRIEKEITIAFWQYGKVDAQPVAGTILQATTDNYKKVILCHVPWKENDVSNIIWECGNTQHEIDCIFDSADSNAYEGKWNHWAFVKNVNSGQMKIYLNSALWDSFGGKISMITGITECHIGATRGLG